MELDDDFISESLDDVSFMKISNIVGPSDFRGKAKILYVFGHVEFDMTGRHPGSNVQ